MQNISQINISFGSLKQGCCDDGFLQHKVARRTLVLLQVWNMSIHIWEFQQNGGREVNRIILEKKKGVSRLDY